MDNLDYHKDEGLMYQYGVSKAGNYFQAVEFAKRYRGDGVVSVPLNPGNLNSELYRTLPGPAAWFLRTLLLHPNVYGACTELFAGLAPEVTVERSGDWGELFFFCPRSIHCGNFVGGNGLVGMGRKKLI